MNKPPILLISGWAHGAEAMHPIAEAFAGSHAVTSLSLAELLTQDKCRLGGAERNPTPTLQDGDISPYARAIALHLDCSDGPACIVGWSTGGIAAIEAAANYPEKVACLVLLSATARFCSAEGYTAGAAPAALRIMIRRLPKSPEAVIADFLAEALHPVTLPDAELARRTQNALERGTDSLIGGLNYLARVDLRETLTSIAAPCLIIHGKQDRIVPWQAARFLASNLSASCAEYLPSAGHSLVEQCGKDLAKRIVQFVGSFI